MIQFLGFIECLEQPECQIENASRRNWAELSQDDWYTLVLAPSAKSAARLITIEVMDLHGSDTHEREWTVWVRRADSEQWRGFRTVYDPSPVVRAKEFDPTQLPKPKRIEAA